MAISLGRHTYLEVIDDLFHINPRLHAKTCVMRLKAVPQAKQRCTCVVSHNVRLATKPTPVGSKNIAIPSKTKGTTKGSNLLGA